MKSCAALLVSWFVVSRYLSLLASGCDLPVLALLGLLPHHQCRCMPCGSSAERHIRHPDHTGWLGQASLLGERFFFGSKIINSIQKKNPPKNPPENPPSMFTLMFTHRLGPHAAHLARRHHRSNYMAATCHMAAHLARRHHRSNYMAASRL